MALWPEHQIKESTCTFQGNSLQLKVLGECSTPQSWHQRFSPICSGFESEVFLLQVQVQPINRSKLSYLTQPNGSGPLITPSLNSFCAKQSFKFELIRSNLICCTRREMEQTSDRFEIRSNANLLFLLLVLFLENIQPDEW